MFLNFPPILTAKRDCLCTGNLVAKNIDFSTTVQNGYFFSTIKGVGNKIEL